METLWQQQDGGYVLLWKRYPNIFYIFNSTVVDWTCLSIIFFYWNILLKSVAEIILVAIP